MRTVEPFIHLCRVGAALGVDLLGLLGPVSGRTALAAGYHFLHNTRALYRERPVTGRVAFVDNA